MADLIFTILSYFINKVKKRVKVNVKEKEQRLTLEVLDASVLLYSL